VVCPHAQFYWWGRNTARDLGVVAGDVLYTCLPLFHTNALNSFFQALIHDAALVADRRFSASGFFDALVDTRATITFVLGAMVPILLGRPVAANERQHRVRVALAPGVPGHFQQDFTSRCGIALIDGYGSTETNCVISSVLGEQRPGYMGKLSAGFDARVVDEHDRPVPDGEAGELILRADEPFSFASGYLGMAEKTVDAWRNLWFHTGDRVVREADGYYRFVDRQKDAIRRRGENVSSFEVEQVLLSHPAVETAAVFAVKSALAEDEVMAALVLRSGAALEPLELIRYCEPRLPYFAVPRYLDFAQELPKTENGKIQKFKLREQGVTPTTWDLDMSGYRLKRS
jgi:crotonobetaine/carnitine-CoA ligase